MVCLYASRGRRPRANRSPSTITASFVPGCRCRCYLLLPLPLSTMPTSFPVAGTSSQTKMVNFDGLNVDLFAVCRICYLSDGRCVSVLSSGNQKMADDVYTVYRVRITDTDKKSKMICQSCMIGVQKIGDLRKKAKQNQRNLLIKIKETYGENVEEVNNKLKFKKYLELDNTKVDEPKFKKKPRVEELKIKEPNTLVPKIAKPNTLIKKFELTPAMKMVIKNKNGFLVCQYCNYFSGSVNEHVTHLSEKHNVCMELKSKDLRFCPVCDISYETKSFLQHLEYCTNHMKMNDGSDHVFLCGSCNNKFKNVSSNQFRNHYIFCKSFQLFKNGCKRYYKCYYCTFESRDLTLCTTHASSTCLYVRMNLKYARRAGEIQELKSLKQLNTIIQSMNVAAIKYCDPSGPKFYNFLHYNCFNCKGVFVNEYLFNEHIVNGVKCRKKGMCYCKMCMTDFEGVTAYLRHHETEVPCYEKHLAGPMKELLKIKKE